VKRLTSLDTLLLCGIATVLIGVACIIAVKFLPLSVTANWTSARKKESIQIGDAIVSALKAYYADHHRYPDALDNLAPQYMSSVPQPTAGDGTWRYFSRGTEFYLQFAVPAGYPSCNYHLKSGQWYEDS
jgi:hypothetical protein